MGETQEEEWDEYIPKHKITIRKHRHPRNNHWNAGGPTYYPCQDTIYAVIIVSKPGKGYVRHAFPFIRENTVRTHESYEKCNTVMLSYGIELDLESNPVFENYVTTFDDAGFESGELANTLIAEPRFINGIPVDDIELLGGEQSEGDES